MIRLELRAVEGNRASAIEPVRLSAGKGYTYDKTRDAFIPPQPYSSWLLNEDTCQWDAPTPMPDDGKMYTWDEDTTSWVIVE